MPSQKWPDSRLEKQGEKLLKKMKWGAELTVVNSVQMTALNEQYRGKAQPTDVLSFPTPEVFQKQGFLGDLVICGPVLRRQAKHFKHSPLRELEVLLVHGVLHLKGWDHEGSEAEARAMAREEQKLLTRVRGKKQVGLILRARTR